MLYHVYICVLYKTSLVRFQKLFCYIRHYSASHIICLVWISNRNMFCVPMVFVIKPCCPSTSWTSNWNVFGVPMLYETLLPLHIMNIKLKCVLCPHVVVSYPVASLSRHRKLETHLCFDSPLHWWNLWYFYDCCAYPGETLLVYSGRCNNLPGVCCGGSKCTEEGIAAHLVAAR